MARRRKGFLEKFSILIKMDLEEAVRAAIAIKPRVVIRMHRSKANPQDYKKKKAAFDRFIAILSQ